MIRTRWSAASARMISSICWFATESDAARTSGSIVESELRGQLPECSMRTERDERSATPRPAEEDIGGGRYLGHDHRLLVDRGNTGPPPGPRVAMPDLVPNASAAPHLRCTRPR